MIAFRRLIPQSSVDDADNAGVREIADQSPDALLELDNHFGNADIHQGIPCDGTLILDNWMSAQETLEYGFIDEIMTNNQLK